MDRVLIAKNLSFYRFEKAIFKDINLEIKKGKKIALVGANGSGKTTLLEVLAGLVSKSSGEEFMFAKRLDRLEDFSEIRQKIGFLFQDSNDQFLFPIVRDDVAFSLLNRGVNKDEAYKKVGEILHKLGIKDLENRVVYNLSGGEKRLVGLAGVLINPVELIFLDEPTNELDFNAHKTLSDILKNLDITMLIASHDEKFVAEICDDIYRM